MASIRVEGDKLTIQINGWDKLLTLRSEVTVNVANVIAVTVRPPDARYDEMDGLRLAGGYWPGSFAAGYFWVTGGPGKERREALEALETAHRELLEAAREQPEPWTEAAQNVERAIGLSRKALGDAGLPAARKYLAFYKVKDPEKAIAIDLEHESVKRIVVEIEGETPEAAAERIRAVIRK